MCSVSSKSLYFCAIKTTTTSIPDGDWWSFLVEVPLNRNNDCLAQLRKASFTSFIIKFEKKKKEEAPFQRLTLLPITAWADWTTLSTCLFSRVKGKTLHLLTFIFHLEFGSVAHPSLFMLYVLPLLVLWPLSGTEMGCWGCWPERLATALLLISPFVRSEMRVLFMGQIVTRTVKTDSPRCHISSADVKPPHFVPVIRRTPRFHIPVIIFSCPPFMLFLSEWKMHQRRPGTLRDPACQLQTCSGKLAIYIFTSRMHHRFTKKRRGREGGVISTSSNAACQFLFDFFFPCAYASGSFCLSTR